MFVRLYMTVFASNKNGLFDSSFVVIGSCCGNNARSSISNVQLLPSPSNNHQQQIQPFHNSRQNVHTNANNDQQSHRRGDLNRDLNGHGREQGNYMHVYMAATLQKFCKTLFNLFCCCP